MTPSAHLRGGPAPTPCNPASSPTGFSSLPTELHSLVAQHLSYPDALSLKQTSRHFRALVRTGAALKVEWLLERRRLHLDCPNSRSCDLGSDLRFCRGSVQKHFECESRPGLGCLVFDTPKCRHRPRGLRWLTRWVTWQGTLADGRQTRLAVDKASNFSK
ncbi:F-box domain-containing [Cordyceps militaris]|uniref:F-box domain-containing n=1 Tax=Cordyceps militaris TaxID=73501 RepID=A0A2H4SVE6_CORMI|nr:F-box domain-containing [Cordyceps militaris]